MTSKSRHVMNVAKGFLSVERADVMGIRKSLASKVLGQDLDELCLAYYQVGLKQGFEEGMDKAVDDIVTDLLSDAVLSMELDVEMLQRIVQIIEN